MALNRYGYGYTFGAGKPGTGIMMEDVLQFIVNMTPAEVPLLATIPTVEVEDMRHTWFQDSLMGTSTAAAAEGFEFAAGSGTVPTRVSNTTQILEKGVLISNSLQRARPHAVDNWYKYQVFKAMREKTRDLERIILSPYTGQSASGSSGTPTRKMRRLVDFCKNASTRYHLRHTAFAGDWSTGCATTFLQESVSSILAFVFKNGGYPDCCHINEAGKRQIAITTVSSSYRRNVEASEREIWLPVDIIENEFGRLELYLNRNMPQVGSRKINTNHWLGSGIFFERGMIRLGVYRPFDHVPILPTGDYMRGYIVGEYTLEVANAKGVAWVRGIRGWAG